MGINIIIISVSISEKIGFKIKTRFSESTEIHNFKIISKIYIKKPEKLKT